MKEAALGVHQTVVAGESEEGRTTEDVPCNTADGGKRIVEEGVQKWILGCVRDIKSVTRSRLTKPSLLENLLTSRSLRSRPVVKNFGEKEVKMTAPS